MSFPSFVAPPQSESSEPRKMLAPGNYPARCYQIVFMGTHDEEFDGKKKTLKKLWLGWEFPTKLDTFQEGGSLQPYTMGKEYTFSMFETAGLRLAVESWQGLKFSQPEADSFEIGELLGQTCLINVQGYIKKNGEKGVKVANISPVIEGMSVPDPITAIQAFSLAAPDWQVFEKLPKFIQDKIKKSKEYLAMSQQPAPTPQPARSAPQPTPAYAPQQTQPYPAQTNQGLVDNLFQGNPADKPVPF